MHRYVDDSTVDAFFQLSESPFNSELDSNRRTTCTNVSENLEKVGSENSGSAMKLIARPVTSQLLNLKICLFGHLIEEKCLELNIGV